MFWRTEVRVRQLAIHPPICPPMRLCTSIICISVTEYSHSLRQTTTRAWLLQGV